MEYQHRLREAMSQLQVSESPRRDVEILLEHVTGRRRTFILAFDRTQLADEQYQQLNTLPTHRRDGGPIAHLAGVRGFWPLPLSASPTTLIPRPGTGCLVEQALARLPEQPCRILDLGTGTRTIALVLASERPDCEIIAMGRMPDAASLAQRNAQHLTIKNIHILRSDWFSALAGQQFAMTVNSPPYIDEQDPRLQQGNIRFEPLAALVAADSGMADIVHIIEQSRNVLVSGGFLLLEHGWQQSEAVRQAFILAGYHGVEACCDYGDNERITLSRYYRQQVFLHCLVFVLLVPHFLLDY